MDLYLTLHYPTLVPYNPLYRPLNVLKHPIFDLICPYLAPFQGIWRYIWIDLGYSCYLLAISFFNEYFYFQGIFNILVCFYFRFWRISNVLSILILNIYFEKLSKVTHTALDCVAINTTYSWMISQKNINLSTYHYIRLRIVIVVPGGFFFFVYFRNHYNSLREWDF